MTLVLGWLRADERGDRELVFACDSRLSGGAQLEAAPKLFDLGRRDCLLGFCGDTHLAYPFVMHAERSISHDAEWRDPRHDLIEVKDHLTDLFTDMAAGVSSRGSGETKDEFLSSARFLLGGWSWRTNDFRLWELRWNLQTQSFTAREALESSGQSFEILVDPQTEEAEARETLAARLEKVGKTPSEWLDMEPFQTLLDISREASFRYIGGRPQVAKVYASGQNEFFGAQWPREDQWVFMGQQVHPFSPPRRRFLDGEGNVISLLPDDLPPLESYQPRPEWFRRCEAMTSPQELSVADQHKLEHVLKASTYDQFLTQQREAKTRAEAQSETEDLEATPTQLP